MSVRETMIAALVTALDNVKEDTSYPQPIAAVERKEVDLLTWPVSQTPLILVQDTGEEELLIDNDTHARIALTVSLVGFVKGNNMTDSYEVLNGIVADIKKFCFSQPTIDDAALSFRFVASDGHQYDHEKKYAACIVRTRLTYACAKGSF